MVGTVRSTRAEPGDEFPLTGRVDYVLTNGETASDHEVTSTAGSAKWS
jgi:hypothetical protein